MSTRRCFLISPIGAEGSAVREHADDVYDYIVKPAMEACDIAVVRADHLKEPGKISEQMFKEILTDDLCIAVLTGSNPNVYYELAVAHAAARPSIIMLEKGQPLPFDIHDLRCVYYTLQPRPLFEKVYVNEIIAHMKALEQANWTVKTPWGSYGPFLQEGGKNDPYRIFAQSVDYGGPDVWLKLLQDTQQAFDLMGIALSTWKSRARRFGEALKQKASGGCKIRVLLMHKDNPSLPHLINSTIAESTLSSIVVEIDEMFAYFSDLANSVPNIEVRQMLHGCPHCQIVRSDSQSVSVFYLYSERTNFSPLLQCPQGAPIYTTLAQEFEALWQANGIAS